MSPRQLRGAPTSAERVLGRDDPSLLDIVDNALNNGVVLNGDLTLGLANVDLVYVRLSLLLAAADRIFPHESTDFLTRRRARASVRRVRAAEAALGEQQATAAGGTRTTRTRTTRTSRTIRTR